MKYIFGLTKQGMENLKTTGERTDYSGEIQLVTEYDDTIITDSCEIVSKYYSAEDGEGTCYDWYEVLNHNRTIAYREFEETASVMMLDKEEDTLALEDEISTISYDEATYTE